MTAAVPLFDLFASADWLTLLDVSLTGIHLVRPVYRPDSADIVDFAIEYLNPAGQRMTGLSEQPGGTLLGRFPHALAEGIFQYYRRTFETGEQLTYETNYQADGLDNYFKFSAKRSGAHLLVSFTDTGDQNRSAVEEALRVSQAAEQAARAEAETQRVRFYDVLMQLPAYVAVYHGPDHVYQLVNPYYQRLFPHREFLGRPFREGTPESSALGVVALFDHVYQTGEPYFVPELEGWFDFHGTGKPVRVFLNLSLHPLRNAQGHIDGVLDFSYDITEQVLARRQVEQLHQEAQAARAEAERERQRFYDVLMQLPAHIALHHGPDQVFTLVNPDYQRIANGRDLLGQPIRAAWPELVSQGILDVLDGVYQTGEPYIANEVPVQADFTRTGQLKEVYYNFFFLPLRDAQGRINGVLNFSYDVTASVRARQQVEQLNQELEVRVQQRTEELAASNEELTATNEELHESNTQLRRTNVDLDTFVYTASHDLKAPITNIESIVLALRETLPQAVQQDELVAHLLGLLDKTVGRFQITITQLTDISRLQLAHAGPAESVVLAAVVKDVRLDLAPVIMAANTQLTVEVAPELVLSFPPANLRSIVYNLLSNAVKYRAPDRPSQVQVRTQQTGATVVLTVQDNGLGLSALQQRQLFGLFQRLHTHIEGTGVGLYITKRLIENAGGTIAVQSQPDIGTTFTVTFLA